MTMSPWPGEVAIDDELVDALLTSQFPALAPLPRTWADRGWDNLMVRLGVDLVMRLPRREIAADLIRHEQRWLPHLATRLTVPIPQPVHIGHPHGTYPWPWTIARWLNGTVAARVPLAPRTAWAGSLAQQFSLLHAPAPPGAPHNPVRAVPLATRNEAILALLNRLAADPDHADLVPRLAARWKRGVAAPSWAGNPTWVHGDPHPGNLLTTPRGTALAGILDFGDLSAGDPACDLATAWLTFDPPGRERFRAAYERIAPPDPGRWERAGAWAVSMVTAVLAASPPDEANLGWARRAATVLAAPDREG